MFCWILRRRKSILCLTKNPEIIDYVEDIMKGNIYLETDNYPGPGKTLTYTIIIKYQRIYTKSIEEMKISRSVLFGYTLM